MLRCLTIVLSCLLLSVAIGHRAGATVLYEDTSTPSDWIFVDNSFLTLVTLTSTIPGVKLGAEYLLGQITVPYNEPKTETITATLSFSNSKTVSGSTNASITSKIAGAGAEIGGTLGSSLTLSRTTTQTVTIQRNFTLTACCSTEKLWATNLFTVYSGAFEWYEEPTNAYDPPSTWVKKSGTWSVADWTGVATRYEEIALTDPPCVPLPGAVVLLASALALVLGGAARPA